MNYFNECETVPEVKSLYRNLAMKFHPDRGGSNEEMLRLNQAYQEALKSLDQTVYTGSDNKYTYYYNRNKETMVIRKVDQLIKLNIDEINIWIVGTWVWVDGNTKPHKESIKSVQGMRWHSKRRKWYWRPQGQPSTYSGKSFQKMAQEYGAKLVRNDEEENKTTQPVLTE